MVCNLVSQPHQLTGGSWIPHKRPAGGTSNIPYLLSPNRLTLQKAAPIIPTLCCSRPSQFLYSEEIILRYCPISNSTRILH
jgi:hypothetical protein